MHTRQLGVGDSMGGSEGGIRKLNLNLHSDLLFILLTAFVVQVCQNALCHHSAEDLHTRGNLKERAFLQKAIY